jgi:3-deoxy-D-manno-octulosonic-acid transferase
MKPLRDFGEALARWLYSALLWLLQPAYLMRLWWRGRVEPLYRYAPGERLGRYGSIPGQPGLGMSNGRIRVDPRGTPAKLPAEAGWLWVHAVSLGETRAAAALIDSLREARPGMRLLLTHSTATGREAGKGLLRPGADRQVWLPFDTPGATRRFFAKFRPAVGVLMETEIWPNLLHAAHAAGVPMVLANARLSDRSQAKGRRLDWLMRPAVRSLGCVLAQTDADAKRLRQSGAIGVQVCGNLKFDVTPDPALLARGHLWRAQASRPVVLFASSREGEEAMVLRAWKAQQSPRPQLLIVPRHPQRFDEVAELVRSGGLTLARRSTWSAAPSASALDADVWLGDSMGEMALYFAASQVCLLGGSFEKLGGQNLIEAAACGCPVIMGPHTFNFADASQRSIEAGAALRVADAAEAVRQAVHLVNDPVVRRTMQNKALAFAAAHRGAADRMASVIAGLMPFSLWGPKHATAKPHVNPGEEIAGE